MRDVLVIDCKVREPFWSNLESNHNILFTTTVHEGLSLLSDTVDLVFLNLDCNGAEVLRLIKKAYPSTECIIITSSGTEEYKAETTGEDSQNPIGNALSHEEMIHNITTRILNDSVSQGRESLLSTVSDDASCPSHGTSHLANAVFKVRDYIIQNYSESISLDDACKMASTSKTYFCRCFKCITGHSLRNYHHLVKVKVAEDLLRDGRFSIADIALKLGYRDSNYFSTIYKRFTGTSPRQRSSSIKSKS